MASGNGCQSCQELDEKELTIEEALETMPIPNKHCTDHLYNETNIFCRCIYEAAGELSDKNF